MLPERGACPIRVTSFENFLRTMGWGVDLYAPAREGVDSTSSVTRYANPIQLFRMLRSRKYDTIWSTSPPLTHSLFAALAAKLSGARIAVDLRDPWVDVAYPRSPFFNPKRWVFQLVEWLTFLLSDVIFIVSPGIQSYITAYPFMDSSKIILAPNGTIPERFAFNAKARADIRKKLGISPKEIVGLYPGAHFYADTDTFIQRLSEIPSLSKIKIMLVVPLTKKGMKTLTPEAEEIRSRLENKGLADRIIWVDGTHVEDSRLGDYFSAADFGFVTLDARLDYCVPLKVYDCLGSGLDVWALGPQSGDLKNVLSKDTSSSSSPGNIYAHSWTDLLAKGREWVKKYRFDPKRRKKQSELGGKSYGRAKANHALFHSLSEGLQNGR
jgi:glycosyltransferase involved in cell wall biosynthesis